MKALIYMILVLGVVSCNTITPGTQRSEAAVLSPYPLHFYTQQLADNLFAQLPAKHTLLQPAAEMAVASFVPVNSLSLSHVDEAEKQLANQLSENMLTHARQRGFVVYDYRLRQQLLLLDDHAQALSWQLDNISATSDADTLLVGTYTPMEDGFMLNARLINIADQQVLAAASGYVPANVLWSRQQVIKQGDKLYRQPLSGERK